jgi:hypothetical protein
MHRIIPSVHQTKTWISSIICRERSQIAGNRESNGEGWYEMDIFN